MSAEFSHWTNPARVGEIKGVVVIVPGSNGDGRSSVGTKVWQSFAIANGVDLVGCSFRDEKPGWIEKYCEPHSTEMFALEDYLFTLFGGPDNVPPVFLWGFSAGGQFAYEYAAHMTGVAGFVVNKGGVYYTALEESGAVREIPSLWIIGAKDDTWRRAILHGIFSLNRQAGANKWLKVVENCGHDVGCSVDLGQRFFKGILEGSRDSKTDLRNVPGEGNSWEMQ